MSKIYLISPENIDDKFDSELEKCLMTGFVDVFQLRLKNVDQEFVRKKIRDLLPICHKYEVPFILNDDYELAIEMNCDGVHIGDEDGNLKVIREKTKNLVLGVSCYDSLDKAMIAGDLGADYVSFGAFFNSKTKKSKGNPKIDILKFWNEYTTIQSVAIGGINSQNYKEISNYADFIAVISYIWDDPENYAVNLQKLIS